MTNAAGDQWRATFAPLRQWEDKYRQLILAGKALAPIDENQRRAAREIAGCENRVWIGHQLQADGRLHFFGDSEGRIVRGLLAILLAGVDGQTPQALRDRDPLALFDELGLRDQLSASRGQGLQAMADAITEIVAGY